jgi:putative ABC transport system permease protein
MQLLVEIIKEAWISLQSYKLRSFLTILGIIIGVGAVVVMVSVGTGVQEKVNSQLSNLGSNLLIVRPGEGKKAGFRSGDVKTLTYEDAESLLNLSTVEKISYLNNLSEQIIYENKNQSSSIYGISPDYFEIQNLEVEKGEYFKKRDYKTGALVAIVGSNIQKDFLGPVNALGEMIRIKNIPFKIIGILKEKGESFGPRSIDDQIFLPWQTFSRRIFRSKYPKSVRQINLKVTEGKYLDYTQKKITSLLRLRHKLKDKDENDFHLRNLTEIKSTVESTAKMFAILLAAVASISLIVGSIGIMNMMLVSVTERTKEIGLRKAIGAPEKTILQQFLFESVLISFLGSFIGLFLGMIVAKTISYFTNINMPISPFSIIISIVVSIIVGVGSGLFPAFKASKLNPIEALGYE